MGFARYKNWFKDDHELEGGGYDVRPLTVDVPRGDDVEAADVGAAVLSIPKFHHFYFRVYLDIASEGTHVHRHIEEVTVIPDWDLHQASKKAWEKDLQQCGMPEGKIIHSAMSFKCSL
ncbi:unnamed protein product [Clonostachys rosea]|uniref:Uncharacterized protein n=1 Tax=Bionectria ochroleuca TaxID=29856 RepID=A0ABY6UM29_BIOOC|nr:unnamed protein product [Clonostachys rosea]